MSHSFTLCDFLQIKEINPRFYLEKYFFFFDRTEVFFFYDAAHLGCMHLAPLLGKPGVKLLSVSG